MFPIPQIARLFQGGSVNRRIFRAAASVTAAGILVKIVATFKEFAVAGVYGRSDAMDAFLAAFLIPNLLINLISESMNQAMVPTLVRVREQEGHERAQELLSSFMLWVCLLLAVASVVMALAARGFFPLIASHFPPAKMDLAIRLFYALLPVVLITGIATNCTAVLNTFDRFALPALAPVATPVAIILGALLLSSRMGIWAL
jgi:putative peptidoglycan lipid II flippase